MKKHLLLLVCCACLATSCARLHRPDGSLDVAQILNDARWGVMAACDQEWLSPADCILAGDTFTFAEGLVAKNVPAVGAAVKQLLVDVETRIPAESRLRPYLDAIISLLM
jgi:hypothetical protein